MMWLKFMKTKKLDKKFYEYTPVLGYFDFETVRHSRLETKRINAVLLCG